MQPFKNSQAIFIYSTFSSFLDYQFPKQLVSTRLE